MKSRLFRHWRVLATGSAFALFGLGGIYAAIVFPLLKRRSRTQFENEARVQAVVQRWFRFFVDYMRRVGILDVEVIGGEKLREPGGQLLVANHPTLLDVVMLGALMPQLDCVVKRAAWSNPFMRGPVVAAGYIPNDAGERLIDRCAERLAQGRSLLIFPEGTRSPKGRLGPLQRGAAHMAIASGRPLRPVFIGCDPPTLMRGQPWYDVPERPMRYTIEIGDPIEPREAGPRGAEARRLMDEFREFLRKRLQSSAN